MQKILRRGQSYYYYCCFCCHHSVYPFQLPNDLAAYKNCPILVSQLRLFKFVYSDG